LREHTYISALLLVAILGAVAHFSFGFSHSDLSGHAWGSDDAYISYRYAQNFVDGHGLVFNPGEKVEGYTNLLYTLIAAIFISINPNMVYIGCFSFNILAYIATLLLFYWYLRNITDENRAKIGFLILCATPVMWAWHASGLEMSSVLFVQLAIFIIADLIARKYSNRLFVLYGCLVAMVIFLRADGFVFAFLSSMILFRRKNYRCFVLAVIIIVAFTLIYIAARYSYYGDILPNTYYVKVSGSPLQRLESAAYQLFGMFKKNAFFLYIIPIIFGAFQVINKLRTTNLFSIEDIPLIPFISLALLAYWVYVGGDVYYERFLLLLIPLSIIYIVSTLPPKWYLTIMFCFLILQFVSFTFDQRFNYHINKYDRWVDLGKFLANKHPQNTLAIDAAGKVPFYSRLPTLDMYGLNNRYIGKKPATFFFVGHNKYDPDYIFEQQPDLIAAWGSKSLNLGCGITKDRYVSNGYTLKYVVNSSVNIKPQNIIDVTGFGMEKIKSLYEESYTYFVISKEGLTGVHF